MRNFLHITGSETWCLNTLSLLIERIENVESKIIFSGDPSTIIKTNVALSYVTKETKRSDLEHLLGTHSSVLIINAYCGFNVELFCALCGTVQSPGLIVLLSPHIQRWPLYCDPEYSKLCSYPYSSKDVKGRFVEYFVNALTDFFADSVSFTRVDEYGRNSEVINSIISDSYRLFSDKILTGQQSISASCDQTKVIEWVSTTIFKQQSELLILTGKRGRGKSTAIGIAVSDLISNNELSTLNIGLISQTRCNVEQIFNQFPETNHRLDSHNQRHLYDSTIRFMPADEYLAHCPDVDLLVVDEAASIPLPQLFEIIGTVQKVILSTTIDGYEGSGMGFSNKLYKQLKTIDHSVTHIKLSHPFRWPQGDQIECFLTEYLLSGNDDNPDLGKPVTGFSLESIKITKINRDQLPSNHKLTSELYSLLSQAHYRTTPDDLRYILDAPGIELWVAMVDDKPCATLILSNEGKIDESLTEQIWLGQRRIKGHLIPQSLCSQAGFRQACELAYKRIVRIAVSGHYRHLGIGSLLLKQAIQKSSNKHSIDFFAVSYGYETQLANFWLKNGFSSVRLGHKANARSGLVSIIMLYKLSQRSTQFLATLEQHFSRELYFRKFNTSELTQIPLDQFNHNPNLSPKPDYQQDSLDIFSFAYGNRQFAHCHAALFKYSNVALNRTDIREKLTQGQIQLITFKVLQNKSWKICANLLQYSGKKQLLLNLRKIFKIIYSEVWGNN